MEDQLNYYAHRSGTVFLINHNTMVFGKNGLVTIPNCGIAIHDNNGFTTFIPWMKMEKIVFDPEEKK